MTGKHVLRTYTDKSLIKHASETNAASVVVIWQIDFDRSLDRFFNKRKYKHDFGMLKQGVGRLEIRLDDLVSSKTLPFIEALAAKHIVSNSGVNAFGFEDDSISIRRDQLKIITSQADTVSLIDRKGVPQSFFEKYNVLSALSSTSAGYLYGCDVELGDDHSWVKSHLVDDASFSSYNRTSDHQIIHNDNVTLPMGEVIINWLSVDEWMNSDLIQFQMKEKDQEFPRPFNLVHDAVRKTERLIYKDNPSLSRLREKFGDECFILTDTPSTNYIQVKKLNDDDRIYLVLGVRHYYAPYLLEEMKSHGFAAAAKNETPENIEKSRKAHSRNQIRNQKSREKRKDERGELS